LSQQLRSRPVGDRLAIASQSRTIGIGTVIAMLVADLRHFLGLPVDVPGPTEKLAHHLASIVRATTAREPGEAWVSAITCRRRPNHKPCTGTIGICRTDLPPDIEWRCTGCGDSGVIRGWEESPFDLMRRPSNRADEQSRYEIPVSTEVASALRNIQLWDLDCERIVFGARIDARDTILTASLDELEALVDSVAAEANHEDNRHRQKRFDAAFSILSSALEDFEATENREPARLIATVASDAAWSPSRRNAFDPRLRELSRKWRIVDSDSWDQETLDLVEPAYIEFRPDGTGSFRFIVVEGWLDCRSATLGGRTGVEFSWEGTDECDRVCGRGWAALDGDDLQLHIYFHMGDDSGFWARRF
jgi:hypothetical protein